MNFFSLLIFLMLFALTYANAGNFDDTAIFQTKMPAAFKEKMRQSDFYKSLISLGSQNSKLPKSIPIHSLHSRLHKYVFSQNKIDLPQFFQTLIYLEDITQKPYEDENFNSYFFDLQATALLKMAAVSRLAETKTAEDEKAKEEELKRLMKAALIRIVQWKILAEEDTYKCKDNEEALNFLIANASKYLFDKDTFNVISRSELNEIALQTSDKFKNRPINKALCEMSKNYINQLQKTGTPIYATEQSNGQLLVHLESAETPVTKTSKKLDVYLNTGEIEPEFVSEEDWLSSRKKIRDDFSKIDINKPVIK